MQKQVQLKATVSEMARKLENLKIDVPFADGVDVAKLTKGDKSPLFVTVEAVNDTVSKGKRRYTPEVIQEIASQINENKPDGYDGHLKDEDRPYARPKSQTIWLGAVVKEVDGKLRLFVKGYVFPYAKELRQYLKAAKATGKKVAVSIYGQAQHVWNKVLGAYDLTNFQLESIDWARSGAEGVPALGYLGVASEMVNDTNVLKEKYPELVKQIVKETQDEMNTMISLQNEGLVKEENRVISEMTKEIETLKKVIVDNYIDNTLKSKVVSETARKVVKSIIVREIANETDLVRVAEMVDDILRLDETKTIVSEMSNKTSFNPLIDNRKSGDTRKFTVIK